MRYYEGAPPQVMKFGAAWRGANFELIDKTTEIAPGMTLIALVSDAPGTKELKELSLAVNTSCRRSNNPTPAWRARSTTARFAWSEMRRTRGLLRASAKWRSLRKISIAEISAVDKPSNKHARAAIMKRDNSEDEMEKITKADSQIL
jgi:hypothetical protein